MPRINPVTDTELDILCYELETLGYWFHVEQLLADVESHRPIALAYDHDIPLYLRQEIQSINARV
jgi:hypothetical protein